MKRRLLLAAILLLGLASIFRAQMRRFEAPVGPGAVLDLVADTQREAARVPLRATRLSDAEEIRIGDEIARRYEGAVEDAGADATREVQAYVETVGRRLAAGARRPLPYVFRYVADPDLVNAFALPGGHVFIGRGLLSRLGSEDELAAVLGHEIEHVDLYHCAERVQIEARLRRLPLGGLAALPVTLFQAGYAKSEELEADREGTRLAVRSGHSPLGAIRVFETMRRLHEEHVLRAPTPHAELSQVAVETLRGYFRSHPHPDERIRQIRDLIDRSGWQTLPETPLEVEVRPEEP
jgi:predicted Zn-dependent protease